MESRLACRLMWRHKWAVALQTLALACGLVVALMCLALYHPLSQSSSIPGASCADQLRFISQQSSSGQWQDRFTWAQVNALQTTHIVDVYPVVNTELELGAAGPVRNATVIGMDTRTQAALCLDTYNNVRLPGHGAAAIVNPKVADVGAQIRLGVATVPVIDQLVGFHGMSGQIRLVDAVVPLSALADAGFDVAKAQLPVLRVLVPRTTTDAQLSAALAGSLGAFAGTQHLKTVSALGLSGDEDAALHDYGRAMAITAVMLILLGLVNIASYQIGRQPEIAWRVKLLRDLGAAPAQLRVLVYLEPMVIAVSAVIIASVLAPVVVHAMCVVVGLQALASSVRVAMSDRVTMLVACLGIAVLVGELRVYAATHSMPRNVRRITDRAFDYIVAIQSVACLAALLIAASATLVYLRAAPGTPAYSMDHVRVYEVQMGKSAIPKDFAANTELVLGRLGVQVNGLAAIADTYLPVQSQFTEGMSAQSPSGNVPALINRVTPDYFKLLKLPVTQPLTAADQPASRKIEASVAIANTAFLTAMRFDSAHGQLISAYTERTDISASRAPQVIALRGQLDEGTSGNDAADSEFGMAATLYLPYDVPHWGLKSFLLFVRYDPAFPLDSVDHAAANAIHDLAPDTDEIVTRNLRDVFEQASMRERMTAALFDILGAGAVLLCLCGVLALGTIRFNLSRTAFAIRFTMGATRRALATLHLRRFMIPVGIGVAGTVIVFALTSSTLVEWLHMRASDPVTVGVAACAVLFGGVVAALLVSLSPLRHGRLADWLRQD